MADLMTKKKAQLVAMIGARDSAISDLETKLASAQSNLERATEQAQLGGQPQADPQAAMHADLAEHLRVFARNDVYASLDVTQARSKEAVDVRVRVDQFRAAWATLHEYDGLAE